MASPMMRWARRSLAVAAGLSLGMVVGEVGLPWVLPGSDGFYVHPPGRMIESRAAGDLTPGITGVSRFTVNSLGIRGRELAANPGSYRIVTMGGSATECLYLDDSKAWPSFLERDLGRTADGRAVWVGNAGKAGANSRDHILHVKYLIPQFGRVDVALIMVGVNDLNVRLAQGDRYAAPPPLTTPGVEARQLSRAFWRVPRRHRPMDGDKRDETPWYAKTEMYHLLRRTRAAFASVLPVLRPSYMRGGLEYEPLRASRRAASRIINELPDLASGLEEYARNLNTIIDLAQARGSRVVLMTQPTLWREGLEPEAERLLWFGGQGDFMNQRGRPYYSARVLAEAMSVYNRRLLRVCETRGSECIDLANLVSKTLENFYDDAHFTEAGGRLVARILREHFARREPFVRAGTGKSDG